MRTFPEGSIMSIRRSSIFLAFAFVLVALGGPAAGQPAPVPAPTAPVPAPPSPVPAPPPPPSVGGAIDHSMRAVCLQELAKDHDFMKLTCEDELAKDQAWFDNLKGRLSEKLNRDIHKNAAHYATANNRHVIAAYAAFWVLTVGFVLMMWRRQRALQAELARLERDLAAALKDGGPR